MDELVKSPTFEELAWRVSEWSLANFGGNVASLHAEDSAPGPYHKFVRAQMNSFCPLLGIAEEFGEFSQAIAMRDQKEIEDAIGDQVIYLCDYITREAMEVPDYHRGCKLSIPASLSYRQCCEIGIGWLMHANLKRIQNIRGMNDREKFVEKAQQGIDLFYFGLFHMSLNKTRNHPLAHGGRVFDAVVAKRNWKKNSADGAGVAE